MKEYFKSLEHNSKMYPEKKTIISFYRPINSHNKLLIVNK